MAIDTSMVLENPQPMTDELAPTPQDVKTGRAMVVAQPGWFLVEGDKREPIIAWYVTEDTWVVFPITALKGLNTLQRPDGSILVQKAISTDASP